MSKKNRNSSTETPPRFYPLRDPDDPGRSDLIPITEEFYRAICPPIWRKQKRLQRSGQCLCPRSRLWTCDADCDVCPHYAGEGMVYLDDAVPGSDGNITIGDTIPSNENVEEAVILSQLLEVLTRELDRLDPAGRKICELAAEGNSDRSIARLLGKAWSSYLYQRDGLYAKLQKALKDYYE